MNRPPRFAYQWLERWLPPGEVGASIRGDLQEEFEGKRPGATRTAWYVIEAARLALAYGFANQLMGGHTKSLSALADAWRHDLGGAVRSVTRQRRYVISTVLTLALGIGATTAIFSILYGALWQPLPYESPDQLVRIADRRQTSSPTSTSSVSVPNYLDLKRASRTVEQFAAYQYTTTNLSDGTTGPRQVLGMDVTPEFFDVLGVRLPLGRPFSSDHVAPGGASAVILSDGLWRDYYGADPQILGQTVRIDLEPHTVIGIAPEGFEYPGAPRLWRPLTWPADWLENRRWRRIETIGRLEGDATVAAAREELTTLFAELERDHPEANEGWTVTVLPLGDWMTRGRERDLLLFGAAVLLVLLISAANAANLMVARAEARAHELAVRAAIGAGRGRILRLLMVEGVGISLLGGGAGIIAAYWGIRSLTAAFAASIPRAESIRLNLVVLGFSIGLSILVGAVVASLVSRQTEEDAELHVLRSGSRTDRPDAAQFRRWMIVSELALTMALATGAALLTTSVWRLRQVDLGVDTRGVLTAAITLPTATYQDNGDVVGFYRALLNRLESDPMVEAAGVISRQPLRGGTNGHFTAAGMTEPTLVEMRQASPATFQALGLRLVSGQSVDAPGSSQEPPRVVVNQALARAFFGDGTAVGRSIQEADGDRDRTFEIAGVVSDLREFGPTEDPRPTAYWPLGTATSNASRSSTIVMRGAGDPRRLTPLLRTGIADLDRSLPLADVTTLEDLAARTVGSGRRAAFTLLGLFSIVGLTLAALGIYSVIAFTVESRTREMGIRMALGATAPRVTALVLWEGMRLAFGGVAIGLVASIAFAHMLQSFLYGVAPADPATLLAVGLLLTGIAAFASLTPALRAAGMPVTEALRDS